jgi:hypothetical protein
MAGFNPATHRDRVCGRMKCFYRARPTLSLGPRLMGGRVKLGHDGCLGLEVRYSAAISFIVLSL